MSMLQRVKLRKEEQKVRQEVSFGLQIKDNVGVVRRINIYI